MLVFSQQEIDITDSVIQEFWHFNGRRISDYSHDEWGWQATEDYDDIPYYMAWVSSDPLTPEQIEVGYNIAKEHNLLA